MSAEIKIELKLVSARAPLKALADVTLTFGNAHVTIRRCPVFEKSGAPPWASLPQLSIQANGRAYLAPIVELGRDLRRLVLKAILESYTAYAR